MYRYIDTAAVQCVHVCIQIKLYMYAAVAVYMYMYMYINIMRKTLIRAILGLSCAKL